MIIGLLGRARAGKDTVATMLQTILQQNHDKEYSIVRLAEPIKAAVSALYGVSRDILEGPDKEVVMHNYNITPREAMQEVTRYYMKKHGDDFFSQRVFTQYKNSNIIVPDIRFSTDTQKIKENNGIVIKVVRDNNQVSYTCEDTVDNCTYDFILHNDKSLYDLQKKVEELSQKLRI